MTTIFPELKHAGPDEHLMWVQKSKEAAGIPVIGSLNAVSKDTWVEYAKKMADTGVDGLELNFFYTPLDFDKDAKAVEDEQVAVVKEVKSSVSVPVSVKLSQFYTNPLQLIKRMNDAGADGFVLFNRMFHPSIDVAKEETDTPFNLSGQNDHRLAARFVGLLHDRVNATLIASHGIHSGTDAVEVLLSGAHGFQVVSTLYKNSINYIGTILDDISSWMDKKGYAGISDFCGKLSAEKTDEKWTYKRAQYAKMLLHSEDYLKRPNLI
jgi:dihydroorotate dehydrogenase (fumarate)